MSTLKRRTSEDLLKLMSTVKRRSSGKINVETMDYWHSKRVTLRIHSTLGIGVFDTLFIMYSCFIRTLTVWMPSLREGGKGGTEERSNILKCNRRYCHHKSQLVLILHHNLELWYLLLLSLLLM